MKQLEAYLNEFHELLTSNKELIDEQTLDYLDKYLMLLYYQDELISDDILVLFKKIQNSRLEKGLDSINLMCLPDEIKQQVEDYQTKQQNKPQLIKQILKEVSNMVRNEAIVEYLNAFFLNKEINNKIKQQNMNVTIDPILIIVGNRGSGKKEIIDILARAYYATDMIFDEFYLNGDFKKIKEDCNRAYNLKRLLVLDGTNVTITGEMIDILFQFYLKGLKVILKTNLESLDRWLKLDTRIERRSQIIYLPDYNGMQLYQVFEKICDQNRIIVSSNASASLKTIFTLYEKENKIKDGNELIARDWFERINMQRYRRNNIPYYEILLEDIINTIKNM